LEYRPGLLTEATKRDLHYSQRQKYGIPTVEIFGWECLVYLNANRLRH